MTDTDLIRSMGNDPKGLEDLYRSALQKHQGAAFQNEMEACWQAAPDNPLYTAWHYRLQEAPKTGRSIPWALAAPLAVLNAGLFFALSGNNLRFADRVPYVFLLWAPVAALIVMGFLSIWSKQNGRRALLISLALAAASLYTLFAVPTMPEQYLDHASLLMVLHLPLLAWAAVGIALIGLRSPANERFAFLIKSMEVIITGGVYLIALAVFSTITQGMFMALGLQVQEWFTRLLATASAGLIPVLAITSIYDPLASPAGQDFRQGLSRFVANLMRLMLPLTLLVLVVYIVFIPFNFLGPFQDRDVLIVYNVMLLGVMAMLVGATPFLSDDLSPRLQTTLRRGILAVAALAVLVSLYALSATVYRTAIGGLTMNRLTILGWNLLNIGLLVLLLYRQLRRPVENWVQELHGVFSVAAVGYTAWALFVVIAPPLLFR